MNTQLDFIDRYIAARNSADGSLVDANANVSCKNVAVLACEIHKQSNIRIHRDDPRRPARPDPPFLPHRNDRVRLVSLMERRHGAADQNPPMTMESRCCVRPLIPSSAHGQGRIFDPPLHALPREWESFRIDFFCNLTLLDQFERTDPARYDKRNFNGSNDLPR